MVILERRPLYTQAYEAVRAGIASRRYEPGAALDVHALSQELGISRTPIREAMRQLSQEGLIEMDSTGHLLVCQDDPETLADIYILRAAIESTSARLLAAAGHSVDFSIPEQAIAEGQEAAAVGDWERVVQANTRFHTSVVALTESAHMVRLTSTIGVHIERQRAVSMQLSERRAASHVGHTRILDLIRSGDAVAAQQEAYLHVIDAAAWVLRAGGATSDTSGPAAASIFADADSGMHPDDRPV